MVVFPDTGLGIFCSRKAEAAVTLLFSVLLILISFSRCKKEEKIPNYTITGKLLESAGNPVPISGFPLTLYRKEKLYGLKTADVT